MARLPPIVAALRICGEPTVRAAWASAGSRVASGVGFELGVGDTGPEADGAGGGVVRPAPQLRDPVDGDDRVAVGDTVASLVHLDHEVGPAGQDEGVGMLGQRGDGRVERPGNQHAHEPELYKPSRQPAIRGFAVIRGFGAGQSLTKPSVRHDFWSPHRLWLVSAASP